MFNFFPGGFDFFFLFHCVCGEGGWPVMTDKSSRIAITIPSCLPCPYLLAASLFRACFMVRAYHSTVRELLSSASSMCSFISCQIAHPLATTSASQFLKSIPLGVKPGFREVYVSLRCPKSLRFILGSQVTAVLIWKTGVQWMRSSLKCLRKMI